MENSFDGKDYVCGRMLQFLMEVTGGEENPNLLSFQLLETLLYRVQLSLFTGRHQNALVLLQVTSRLRPQELSWYLQLSNACDCHSANF